MRIAAILTIPECQGSTSAVRTLPRSYPNLDIMGATLVQRTIERIRALTEVPAMVLGEQHGISQMLPFRSVHSGNFLETWETAISKQAHSGVDLLLLARVGAYTDLDYSELVRFHVQTRSRLTQVYCSGGSLDVAVIDASLLRNTDQPKRRILSSLIPQQKRFNYSGYVNWLREARDIHDLVEDSFAGRCGLRPTGTELGREVWYGNDVEVDATATITGPAYIGSGTRLRAGCAISGPTSIEKNCEIDCGTEIAESVVLQETYVGVALDMRRAVVSGERLFHLDRNVEIRISDSRLIGRNAKPAPLFAGLTSLFRGEAQPAQ